MKLWFLLVPIIAMAISNVQSQDGEKKFDDEVIKEVNQCYVNTQLRDLARSLPMTLDYFLNIIEKIQRHPSMKTWKAHEMAAAILKRFQINGIEDKVSLPGVTISTFDPWNELTKMQVVRQFLIKPPGKYVEETLAPEEECALHFMLSWSNNVTSPEANDYPRSSGLVYSVIFGNLAMGPVLQGIASDPSSKTVQMVIDEMNGSPLPESSNETLNSQLLGVSAATLAAELGQTVVWSTDDDRPFPRRYVGPNGNWNGGYCPNKYMLTEKSEQVLTMATAPEIVGAIDGFLIASAVHQQKFGLNTVTLAQIIRMYYGKGLEADAYNACERKNRYGGLSSQIHDQTKYFAFTLASIYKMAIKEDDVNLFVGYVMDSFKIEYLVNNFLACNESNSNYFNGKNQKNELKNDVLFVMDVESANSDEGFWEQKEFVLNLMREVDALLNGSRYGLYTNGVNQQEVFKLDPSYSSARRRCDLLQKQIKPTTTDMPATISFMNNLISGLKELQATNRLPLAPGKVILFIYLEKDFGDKKEAVVKEINSLKARHPDVTILAVGRNLETLKMLVRDKVQDVFYRTGEPLVYHVPKLLKRFTNVPITLEYADCVSSNRDLEAKLIGKEFVYSSTNQWFSVPHIYMNASTNMEIKVRADYGTVKVCTTRKNPETFPSFESKDCKEASNTAVSLGPMNPCSGYPFGGCANYYFQVQGSKKAEDMSCDSLHQIQLTITHSDMRCAGSFTEVEISFLVLGLLVNLFTLWA